MEDSEADALAFLEDVMGIGGAAAILDEVAEPPKKASKAPPKKSKAPKKAPQKAPQKAPPKKAAAAVGEWVFRGVEELIATPVGEIGRGVITAESKTPRASFELPWDLPMSVKNHGGGSNIISISVLDGCLRMSLIKQPPSAIVDEIMFSVHKPDCKGATGTMLLNLSEHIARVFGARKMSLSDCSTVKMHGVGVPFSLYRMLNGQIPWYEKHGFLHDEKTVNKFEEHMASGDPCMGCDHIPWARDTAVCNAMCASDSPREAGRRLVEAVDVGDADAIRLLTSLSEKGPCLSEKGPCWTYGGGNRTKVLMDAE
jgi:hypothetical protein